MLPVALTVAVILIFMKPWRSDEPARDGAYERMELVQKGGLSAVTSLFGGPAGAVWYAPTGPGLSIRASAHHLDPGTRYIFEIQVDSTVYDVASLEADARGELALDSTFSRVAEGICVGGNYDRPIDLAPGRSYTLGFMLKRDGNPASGTQRVSAGSGPEEAAVELGCSGNADGDYSYVLLENRQGRFTVR